MVFILNWGTSCLKYRLFSKHYLLNDAAKSPLISLSLGLMNVEVRISSSRHLVYLLESSGNSTTQLFKLLQKNLWVISGSGNSPSW